MELFQTVVTIAGGVITLSSLCALFIKPFRKYIIDKISKDRKDGVQDQLMMEIRDVLKEHIEQDAIKLKQQDLQNEALLCVLRDNITRMYYRYTNVDTMPSYEKENLVKQYTVYHKMNGNSYVDIVFEELKGKPVK